MKKYLLYPLFVTLTPLTFVCAQDATWDGSTSDDWSEGANWSGDTVPTGEALFDLTSTEVVDLGSPTSITSVEFSGSGAWTFNGSDLTVTGAPAASGTRPFSVYNPVDVTFNNAVVFDVSGGANNEHINFDVNSYGTFDFAGGIKGNSSDPTFTLRTASKLVGDAGVNVTIGSLTDISSFNWRTANSTLTLAGASSVDVETHINTGFAGDITLRLAHDDALGTGALYINHSNEGGSVVKLEAVDSDRSYSNNFTTNGGWENSNVSLFNLTGDHDLTFTGTLQLNRSASFEVDAGLQLEFGGSTTGGNQIIKEGTGVLVLSGASIGHTGHTYVNEGTLLVNGSFTAQSSPDVIVTDAAVLGGTGSIGRDVVFTSGTSGGGVLNPGLIGEVGTLTINGGRGLTLASDSILAFDIGVGGAVDLINVGGDLILDGILNLNDLGLDAIGDYTIVSYSGNLTDNGLVLGSGPDGWVYNIFVDEGNKDVLLQITAIPEARLASIFMGMAALWVVIGGRRLKSRE
ncbi:hypothetical protein SH580_03125 [Coraliomargarita algicola]|uniref:Autotransporter-associated beta strand repeat protein n=1 Tax=Coraliomargarita algicola TaxID=3092156 RepID=A0ABZ0RPM8_9BACT|nr:hypothetical protein [Coraliomargarita sp. J2-16]WPJ96695.1 hypothetical protein SH580_03125 [Coraliomargarita sp. J2-16]